MKSQVVFQNIDKKVSEKIMKAIKIVNTDESNNEMKI